MPKISKITPSVAKSIDEDITAAVKSVEKKWGVNISVGGGTYDSDSFTSKVKVSLEGVDTGKKEWDRFCFRFGLKPEQYGQTFSSRGETFTVSGIAPKGKKYPILAKNARGTTYKFSLHVLD